MIWARKNWVHTDKEVYMDWRRVYMGKGACTNGGEMHMFQSQIKQEVETNYDNKFLFHFINFHMSRMLLFFSNLTYLLITFRI
jgi:hypothetical protein